MISRKTAVVVTTYNQPRFLGMCLKALEGQTDRDFFLFIADDGSGIETREKIESFRESFLNPLQHFWQPDEGYQKAKINNSVFKTLGEFSLVICMDHDTISHRRFIEDHKAAHARHRRLLYMGRRIDLGKDLTESLTEVEIPSFQEGLTWKLLQSGLRGETRGVTRSVRVPQPFLQRLLKRDRVPDLLGSNFSISRELLFEVNGYNEDFQSYWGEDGDLFVRVRNSSAEIVGSKSMAIQFHLYHKPLDPDPESVKRYQELLLTTDYRRCTNGIVKG